MAAQIKAELDKVHGDTATTLKTVYFWINEFKRGRTSTKYEAHPGRSVEASAPEMIEKIHHIIMQDHMGILCNTSKPFARKTANRTSEMSAKKNPFSSKRTHSHFCSFNGKSAWIRVQTLASSILFSWFSFFWLLFTSKPQDLARGKRIFIWWRGYRHCECVFWRLWNFLLLWGDKKIRRASDEACWCRKELCWKIKKNLA